MVSRLVTASFTKDPQTFKNHKSIRHSVKSQVSYLEKKLQALD